MITVFLRFYEELIHFLRKEFSNTVLTKALDHRTTAKDIIESFGVPHTEVDLILVNGTSVDFNYHVDDGDSIDVYPISDSADSSGGLHLQERTLPAARFVADVHLGKLVRKMRILGIDVSYRNDFSDEELLEICQKESRALLTMDRYLLMHNVVRHGYLVRSHNPADQIFEVVRRFTLINELKPFTRCPTCNGLLRPVPKSEVLEQLEPKTKIYFDVFVCCEVCGKIFWEGSHFERLNDLISNLYGACQNSNSNRKA